MLFSGGNCQESEHRNQDQGEGILIFCLTCGPGPREAQIAKPDCIFLPLARSCARQDALAGCGTKGFGAKGLGPGLERKIEKKI